MTKTTFTQDQVNAIVAEAFAAARKTAENYFHNTMQGRDQFPCGFAWVDICGVKGNTKLGRMLAAAGIRKNDYTKTHQVWNPSGMPVQNVDCLEAGANEAAAVFRKYGFTAHAGSRWD